MISFKNIANVEQPILTIVKHNFIAISTIKIDDVREYCTDFGQRVVPVKDLIEENLLDDGTIIQE